MCGKRVGAFSGGANNDDSKKEGEEEKNRHLSHV